MMPSRHFSSIFEIEDSFGFSASFPRDDIFPCSSLSDEELDSFNDRSYYPSHRLLLENDMETRVVVNPTSPHLLQPLDVCPHRFIDTHNLRLVEFRENSIIPPYAILSHRWIRGKEIDCGELFYFPGKTKLKSGYLKIMAACQQARRDGLRFIWVDTCCIEQMNHVDLRTNITSMYAYYQNSQVCYAYLSDVRARSELLQSGSDWLRRGWTLQELLAPRTVVFFDKNWGRIGDKNELREVLYLRTSIPPMILSSQQSIEDMDVLTRMSWVSGRLTTRPQDLAYCLQGLLGVSPVEPNYEEGSSASFNRLGKALFDVHTEFEKMLGITDNLFRSNRWIWTENGKETPIKNPMSPALIARVDICPRRLIDTCSIRLVVFSGNATIPRYAILSHRWNEEVLYKEFLRPREGTFLKAGYQKIVDACQQARNDGIRYLWIDTCCIQQGNHADVRKNITSMYAYYQNAEVCYVYLADVPWPQQWFGLSQWFKRGWTLQELLAPRTVIFFNQNWKRISDKEGLCDDIHRRTTIPSSVLSGKQSIRDVDVLTRISWAMQRTTTKLQDSAYCVQGLLGLSVEPDYTEYWITSFNRLGRTLFEVYPELKGELGITDDLFYDPNNRIFYDLLHSKFRKAVNENWYTR